MSRAVTIMYNNVEEENVEGSNNYAVTWEGR